MVHAVVELEVADREFGAVDVIVQRIESGLVETVVLGELGVEPLERIEILSLVGVIERLAEIEVLNSAPTAGRAPSPKARPSSEQRVGAFASSIYHSPSAIGALPESGPASVSPTSFGFTSLRKVKCSVRLKSAPPSSLPSTSTSSW